ncbi:type II secretion system F family protein [Paenibacillus sp. sgz500958]|uniref:type II secretion system F family protein n=1 Tax=Paenibacillus sp. sgz500958 TaxID=3242475 RepID=UPI0036D40E1E
MNWVCSIVLLLLIGGWIVLRVKSGNRYANLRGLPIEGLRLRKLGEPLLLLVEYSRITRYLPSVIFKIRRSLQKSQGMRNGAERTLLFLGEMLSYSWLMLAGGCVITLASGESFGWVLGMLLAAALPVALISDLHKKVAQREQEIILELPELLSSIVLLVGAGETVQQALVRCCASGNRAGSAPHPLYRELQMMIGESESGYSFQQAFENFSKRCAVQEVSLFTTTVLLNYRRGGGDFALSLRDLSRVLWEKRKAISRTRGEQASAKLVFPMVVIFLIVIVLVGTPAIMMLNM